MTWPQYLRHECTVDGFRVKLSPTQTEILSVLLMRYPQPVARDDMLEAVWFEREEPEWRCGLWSHVRKLAQRVGTFRIGMTRHARFATMFWLHQTPADQRS